MPRPGYAPSGTSISIPKLEGLTLPFDFKVWSAEPFVYCVVCPKTVKDENKPEHTQSAKLKNNFAAEESLFADSLYLLIIRFPVAVVIVMHRDIR